MTPTQLAARCEAAEASEQREFLKRAFRALPRVEEYYWQRSDWGLFNRLLCAEAFVDAAIMLLPEGHLYLLSNTGIDDRSAADFTKATAAVALPHGPVRPIQASTPALALAAASLRAIPDDK